MDLPVNGPVDLREVKGREKREGLGKEREGQGWERRENWDEIGCREAKGEWKE